MADAVRISDIEAIRTVIAEGGSMDFTDVIDVVRKRFGLSVSSGLVEEVHGRMRQEITPKVGSRINLNADRTEPDGVPSSRVDHLALALQYVKSVQGLQNAKQALADLESIMRELKD